MVECKKREMNLFVLLFFSKSGRHLASQEVVGYLLPQTSFTKVTLDSLDGIT
jgi:hypothetical protein